MSKHRATRPFKPVTLTHGERLVAEERLDRRLAGEHPGHGGFYWALLEIAVERLQIAEVALAKTCHNCAPEAVEAFVGAMIDECGASGARCPFCWPDYCAGQHANGCPFKAMLASRQAQPGTEEAKP